ncbi:MAG: hypothetical protein WCS48_03150 [Candidatus Izemoplasmatales bacterium]
MEPLITIMFKLQLYYLMNRTAMWFLSIALLVVAVAFLYSSRFYETTALLDAFRSQYQSEYLYESVGITKFVMVTVSLFLNLHCFLGVNGKYAAFFVSKHSDRLRFIISKMAMISLITTIMCLATWCIFNLIGIYLTPYHTLKLSDAVLYGYITIEAISLGLIEALLMQLFDSLFSGIIPMIGFWGMELFASDEVLSDNKIITVVYQVLPHIINKNGELIVKGTWICYMLFLVTLLMINIFVFQIRDIK